MWKLYGQLFAGLPREVWLLSLVTFVQRSGTMVLYGFWLTTGQ